MRSLWFRVSGLALRSERLLTPCFRNVFKPGNRDTRLETVLSRLPRFRSLFTFVNFEGILHGNIFMDNGAHRLDHSDGRVGLKNIPPHIDTHGAPLDGIMG